MIDPIAAVGAADLSMFSDAPQQVAAPALNGGPATFMDRLERSVEHINSDVVAADSQVRSLALGETDNLHGVLISLETARVSMGVMVQVRNRLVDVYQDVMRMQI